MTGEVRVEDLVGRRVVDGDGTSIGHLEEVVADWEGGDLVVSRYLIGVRGLARRLLGETWRSHESGLGPSYAAKPHQIDISDPLRPRLTCPVSDLDRLPSAAPEASK